MMTEMEFIQFLNKKSVSESESFPTEVISHAVLFVRPLPEGLNGVVAFTVIG